MDKRKTPIEHLIRQVNDGVHYKGHLSIDGVTLDFELKLAIPIPQLEKMRPADIRKAGHSIFDIVVKKNGVRLELGDEELAFLAHLLLMLAEKLYHEPRARAVNAAIKTIVSSIAREEKGVCDFGADECKMLHRTFGCTFSKSH